MGQPVCLDKESCPSIQAGGIRGDNRTHYHLENDGIVIRRTVRSSKPIYLVPSMKEIAAISDCGFRVASTFSGCGGSGLGFRMEGFRILWANEFVEHAYKTYRANASTNTIISTEDIRKVQPEDVLSVCGLRAKELDVLEGSPPCQPFSLAGKRQKSWGKMKKYGDHEQRADDLFFEFVRLLNGLQPRAFVAENVAGLVRGVAKGYFKEILRALKNCGYVVEARLLDAQWLGVPQARLRVIFQGIRNDLETRPTWPKPFAYNYSVTEVMNGIAGWGDDVKVVNRAGGWPRGTQEIRKQPSPTITTQMFVSKRGRVSPNSHGDISEYAIGKEAESLPEGGQSAKYFNLIRASRSKPSPAITASGGAANTASVIHPTEQRKFTIDELKRICSFPDDFQMSGSYSQQWARIGNSVPPLMMRAVAREIKKVLLGCPV